MFNFIDKVGLEIEGCWSEPRCDLVVDGSMREFEFKRPFTIDGNRTPLFGELVSIPFASLEEVIHFLDKNWVAETGQRCGYHIHISLRKYAYYCALMSQSFLQFFLSSMEEWGQKNNCKDDRFWERLSDRNKFCRLRWIPDTQVNITKKTVSDERRYCVLNFCWGLHKTLENRLFPTFFDVEMAKSATIAFLNCVEDYLAHISYAPFIHKTTIIQDEPEVIGYKLPKYHFLMPKSINYHNCKIYANNGRSSKMKRNYKKWEPAIKPELKPKKFRFNAGEPGVVLSPPLSLKEQESLKKQIINSYGIPKNQVLTNVVSFDSIFNSTNSN